MITKEEIQNIKAKDLFNMLSSEQKATLCHMVEVEYIKEDIEQDYWRWGELEEVPEELEQALKNKAEYVYDCVEEYRDNNSYSTYLHDAITDTINRFNLGK